MWRRLLKVASDPSQVKGQTSPRTSQDLQDEVQPGVGSGKSTPPPSSEPIARPAVLILWLCIWRASIILGECFQFKADPEAPRVCGHSLSKPLPSALAADRRSHPSRGRGAVGFAHLLTRALKKPFRRAGTCRRPLMRGNHLKNVISHTGRQPERQRGGTTA